METSQTNWRVKNNQTAFTNPNSSTKPLEIHENYPNNLDSWGFLQRNCNKCLYLPKDTTLAMEMLSHMIYFHSNFLNTKMFSTCSVANLIVIHMCLYVKAIIWCGLTNILLKISRHHKKLPKFSWTTEYHTWHWYLVLNDSQEGKFENINWQVRKIKKLRIVKFLKNWTQNLLNMENNPNPYIISAHWAYLWDLIYWMKPFDSKANWGCWTHSLK